MQSIQQVRSALKRHPLLAVSVLAVVAFASAGAAFVLGVGALVCLVGPRLLEKLSPEYAVDGAVRAVRAHGLRQIQRATSSKASLSELGLFSYLSR